MLYHKQFGMPDLSKVLGHYVCKFTNHALMACLNDRYGKIIPPLRFEASQANVIEAEILGNSVAKLVVRQSYNETMDICIAFIPEKGIGRAIVKTVWLNEKSDNHETLNKSAYKA